MTTISRPHRPHRPHLPDTRELLVIPSVLPSPGKAEVVRRMGQAARSAYRNLSSVVGARAGSRRPDGRAFAAGLSRTFEDLGGTFTKFGQLIGSSPSLFGEEVAAEFRSCLDAGPPIPFPEVKVAVEDDLGLPLDRLFDSFDPEPIAAASLAVVHRATLPDGERVAVKVLRPDIERALATDLAVLRPLMHWASRQIAIGVAGELGGLIDGLAEQLAEEVDLRNETRSMVWFEEICRQLSLDHLVIPEPVAGWSGRRTLTMTFVEGVAVDDLSAIADLGVDPAPLVQETVKAWFATALCQGAFHGDIHAGNLLVTPDSRLAVLDWGIVGRLDPETLHFFRRLVEGALGDESAWPEIRVHLQRIYGEVVQDQLGLDDSQMEQFIRAQVQAIFGLPFGQVDLTALLFAETDALSPAEDETSAMGWYRTWRAERARRREIESGGGAGTPFDRGMFLLGKQLVYFDRYGKLFLPDIPLLWDPDAFRTLLAQPVETATAS